MEFEGKVLTILAPVSGTSARGEWKKQEIVFEQDGEFGKKVCVSFWGDKAADAAGLREGDKVSVAANVESREYNGRWFTEVRAWKLSKQAPAGAARQVAEQLPPLDAGFASTANDAPYKEENFDDLPF